MKRGRLQGTGACPESGEGFPAVEIDPDSSELNLQNMPRMGGKKDACHNPTLSSTDEVRGCNARLTCRLRSGLSRAKWIDRNPGQRTDPRVEYLVILLGRDQDCIPRLQWELLP